MKLHEFLQNNNIARYRRLLVTAEDDAERKTITELLNQELAKQRQMSTRERQTSGRTHIAPFSPHDKQLSQ